MNPSNFKRTRQDSESSHNGERAKSKFTRTVTPSPLSTSTLRGTSSSTSTAGTGVTRRAGGLQPVVANTLPSSSTSHRMTEKKSMMPSGSRAAGPSLSSSSARGRSIRPGLHPTASGTNSHSARSSGVMRGTRSAPGSPRGSFQNPRSRDGSVGPPPFLLAQLDILTRREESNRALLKELDQRLEASLDAVEAAVSSHDQQLKHIAQETLQAQQAHRQAMAALSIGWQRFQARRKGYQEEERDAGQRIEQIRSQKEVMKQLIDLEATNIEHIEESLLLRQEETENARKLVEEAEAETHLMEDDSYGLTGEVKELVIAKKQVEREMQVVQEKLMQAEVTRRELYSTSEALNGCIRVYGRVRGNADAVAVANAAIQAHSSSSSVVGEDEEMVEDLLEEDGVARSSSSRSSFTRLSKPMSTVSALDGISGGCGNQSPFPTPPSGHSLPLAEHLDAAPTTPSTTTTSTPTIIMPTNTNGTGAGEELMSAEVSLVVDGGEDDQDEEKCGDDEKASTPGVEVAPFNEEDEEHGFGKGVDEAYPVVHTFNAITPMVEKTTSSRSLSTTIKMAASPRTSASINNVVKHQRVDSGDLSNKPSTSSGRLAIVPASSRLRENVSRRLPLQSSSRSAKTSFLATNRTHPITALSPASSPRLLGNSHRTGRVPPTLSAVGMKSNPGASRLGKRNPPESATTTQSSLFPGKHRGGGVGSTGESTGLAEDSADGAGSLFSYGPCPRDAELAREMMKSQPEESADERGSDCISSSSSSRGTQSSSNRPSTAMGVIPVRTLTVHQTRQNATSTGSNQTVESFTFDRVFDGQTTQEAVYKEVEPLILNAVDGFSICIFAYGQTGSGKTFSMEGNLSNPALYGIIPRAMHTVFDRQKVLETEGWRYEFRCSVIEIYNDTLRDLLQPTALYECGGAAYQQPNYHTIQHHLEDHSTTVTRLREQKIVDYNDFKKVYQQAVRHRRTAATILNARSSRSHCIFLLHLDGVNDVIRQRCQGKLCLVDLAGSERVNDSGVKGQQLKEAININKSLLDLGKCISALRNSALAPWRNSKLTYLLQNYLGAKGGKMLMLVTVSNKREHVSETVNALRFAARVSETVVGPSVKRVVKY